MKPNLLPSPILLFTQTFPPCISTYFFTIASPRPVPGCSLDSNLASWEKGSKSFLWSVMEIPGPESVTLIETLLFEIFVFIFIRLFSWLNFIALFVKLYRICLNLVLSALMVLTSLFVSHIILMFFFKARGVRIASISLSVGSVP